MNIVEGKAGFRGHETWYRVIGDLASPRAPVVVVHGGPGCTHDYVDSFKDLARHGRAVVHYDQLGNGRSTHLRDRGADFWTVDLFLAELDNLLAHLRIADRYHLIGQSWGGMLGAEHGVRRPPGLRSLVIANSPASMALWVSEANRLRLDLPAEIQDALLRHEIAGSTTHPEYETATRAFYARHVCRLDPWPEEVTRTFEAITSDPTVYASMNGPNEFHVIGTLRDWSIVDRLPRVVAPTLLISGRYDEATEATIQPFADLIPDVRWTVFEDSSHMPHVEERILCMDVVGRFLEQHD